MSIIIPEGYRSTSSIKETEIAIKEVKDYFERMLAKELNLTRVSAPLFVKPDSGLNDNLNGVERPVTFGIREQNDEMVEIVHSLAKWKRWALGEYGFKKGEGLYTDMTAIRRDEDTDNLHSLYVDQWDWELIISKKDRTVSTLKSVVRKVYEALKNTEIFINSRHPEIKCILPESIKFVTTQELLDRWPDKTPKERETAAAREYGAIFLMQIGDKLSDGKPHDGRAPDYDDWALNGDIIVYYPLLDMGFEISSMGIRVDEDYAYIINTDPEFLPGANGPGMKWSPADQPDQPVTGQSDGHQNQADRKPVSAEPFQNAFPVIGKGRPQGTGKRFHPAQQN